MDDRDEVLLDMPITPSQMLEGKRLEKERGLYRRVSTRDVLGCDSFLSGGGGGGCY